VSTVVLGLDGAAFELIRPWIEDGSLPTFRRLESEGVATDMESCLPPVTCPNWQCYATGTNPGRLGVFWWERVDTEDHQIGSTSTQGQFDATHYWQYLDGEVAVVNLPTSYPPPEVDGVHIAGGPGAQQSGYTNPADVESSLESAYDYKVHPQHMGELSADDVENPCIDEIYALIDSRFDVLERYLSEGRFELIHVSVFYINVLQHFYWDHGVTKRAWERIDERVSDLLAGEELDTLFVMSDHGSNEIEREFRINDWLREEGYLEVTESVTDLLYRAGITKERIRSILSTFGVERTLRQIVPTRLQHVLPAADGGVDKTAKAGLIDWEASVAMGSGQGPLYVLAGDERRRREVQTELIERLDGLSHRGRTIVEEAVPAREVYDGPYLDTAPAIVLRQAPRVHIDGSVDRDRDPFGEPTRWRGENKQTGLFVAHGESVDPDATPSEMNILDIAPTVLHRHGAAIPDVMDGTVRTELFETDSEPGSRRPEFRAPLEETSATTTEEADVTDRLSDLGCVEGDVTGSVDPLARHGTRVGIVRQGRPRHVPTVVPADAGDRRGPVSIVRRVRRECNVGCRRSPPQGV
jgi:predicted AlkP superfamily phosphohydrolase/phosphomutase